MQQIHRLVTDKGRQGLLSRSRQQLESNGLKPGDEETLSELRALHPKAFAPEECERRAKLQQRLDAAKARHGTVTLRAHDVWAAVSAMPRPTATWTPVIFMR